MKISSQCVATAVLLATVALASCSTATTETGPRTVQPGAPGESSQPLPDGQRAAATEPRHTEADVRFMQDMIAHHQQALEMAGLVPERSSREDVRLLARRIEVSQADEIALMTRWLTSRGGEVPGDHAHHQQHGEGGHAAMPGMLSAEEIARLAAATGSEFDRLLLQFMIRHHEGAVIMVEQLFGSHGAGQDGEIFQFAADVAGDQQIEIDRMRRMLVAAQ
ncbi:DUF305 domain-containing protein [soil metagenome]|nr:DUF305 domain-containing protein [Gemmatimonadota bacterium]